MIVYAVFALVICRICIPVYGFQCLSCGAVTNPQDCSNSADCPDDKICDSNGGSSVIIIGKRQVSNDNIACCKDDYCNEDMSLLATPAPTTMNYWNYTHTTPTWLTYTTTPPMTTSPLATAIPYQRCQDSKYTCKQDILNMGSPQSVACADPLISTSCKDTCGLCGKSGNLFYVDVTKMDGNAGGHIELLMVNMERGVVDINIPYLNISQNLNLLPGFNKFKIAKDIIPTGMTIENKGVEVKSSVPISLFVMNIEAANADGYSVIPFERLGTEYFVPATVGENELTILSPYSGNSITVKLRIPNGNVQVAGVRYSDGQSFQVNLNKLDTFELNAYSSFAGTKITSDFPIAIVSGDRCTGLEGVGCDHLLDMIPPVTSFSTDFIIPKLVDRKNSTIQVISSSDKTSVQITEVTSNHISQKTLDSGDHMDTIVVDWGVVSASDNVLVTMFVHACCAPVYHEPFMMVVPGINQYLSEYDVGVWDAGSFENHLTVILPSGELSGLMLDNAQSVPSTTPYPVSVKNKSFVVFSIRTSVGYHRMVHNKGTKFGLFVHGNTYSNGYGYAAGMQLN